MYLCDPIFNVINFSVFDHTSCGKHGVLLYGIEEADSINVYEVASDGDLPVLICWNLTSGMSVFCISTCDLDIMIKL